MPAITTQHERGDTRHTDPCGSFDWEIRLRELLRQRDAEAFGPRAQCRQDVLMKLNTFANLTPSARERAFSGKANRRVAGRDRRLVAQRDEVLHLARERVAPAERIRIDQLQEHRRASTASGFSDRPCPASPDVSASTMSASENPLWPSSSPPSGSIAPGLSAEEHARDRRSRGHRRRQSTGLSAARRSTPAACSSRWSMSSCSCR